MTDHPAPAPEVPQHCPFCGAGHPLSSGKPAADTSYYRCARCGEIWNVARVAKPRAVGGWNHNRY